MVLCLCVSATFISRSSTLLLSLARWPRGAGLNMYASSMNSVPPSASSTILANSAPGSLSARMSLALVSTGSSLRRYPSSTMARASSVATVVLPHPGFPTNRKFMLTPDCSAAGGRSSTSMATVSARSFTSRSPARAMSRSIASLATPCRPLASCHSVSGSSRPGGGTSSANASSSSSSSSLSVVAPPPSAAEERGGLSGREYCPASCRSRSTRSSLLSQRSARRGNTRKADSASAAISLSALEWEGCAARFHNK